MQKVREYLSIVISAISVVLVEVALIMHFYYNYIEDDMRYIIACILATFIAGNDVLYIPVCQLLSRCKDVHCRLSELLARSIEFTYPCTSKEKLVTDQLGEESEGRVRGEIYDNLTIWLLRKELSHREQTVDNHWPYRVCHLTSNKIGLSMHSIDSSISPSCGSQKFKSFECKINYRLVARLSSI